jgi:hypothetical protein
MLRLVLVRGALLVGIALSGPALADGTVQNQVSVYTGSNARGYLQPLTNAFGAALNSSFGYSAFIPQAGYHLSFEVPVMGVLFEDSDRTFDATTEAGFQPSTTQRVPTAVGNGDAVTISGSGGASYSFPGGLDLHSFGLVVPQLRLANQGTEAVLRWVAYETGDADIGKVELFGIGGRHSLSQYTAKAPVVDLAIGAVWQTFHVGENERGGVFCKTDALSIHLQASKRVPAGFATFEPYGGVAWERMRVDIAYEDSNAEPVDIAMEGENPFRFTVGAGLNFVAGHLWLDYSMANTSVFSFGLALGNIGRPE